MSLLVVAHPNQEFEAWRAQQIKPAQPPKEYGRERGLEIFLSNACAMCHTVRGTPASGKAGPDLTHLASRHYIAAGALPRNRDTLAAWIIDPEHIKPGARMPPSKLQTNEVELLVSYLQGLK